MLATGVWSTAMGSWPRPPRWSSEPATVTAGHCSSRARPASARPRSSTRAPSWRRRPTSRVLRAHGGEVERELSFGLVRELFEPLLRGADPVRPGPLALGRCERRVGRVRRGARGPVGCRVCRLRAVLAARRDRGGAARPAGRRRPALVRPVVAALAGLPGPPGRGPSGRTAGGEPARRARRVRPGRAAGRDEGRPRPAARAAERRCDARGDRPRLQLGAGPGVRAGVPRRDRRQSAAAARAARDGALRGPLARCREHPERPRAGGRQPAHRRARAARAARAGSRAAGPRRGGARRRLRAAPRERARGDRPRHCRRSASGR